MKGRQMTIESQLARLLDRQAITEQIYRYGRGVDRMDAPLTRSCWHGDGTADYRDMFEGTVDGLIEWMWKVHAAMQTHSHQMTNILIELDAAADRAVSETYATVALRSVGEAPLDIVTRGRYLDRWSRRGGVWAIDHRIHLTDHMTTLAVPKQIPTDPNGARDRSDPSYSLLG
jgi:hypothetical protein